MAYTPSVEERVQSVMDYVAEEIDDMDPDLLWEFYSILSFRCRSKIDDLDDAIQERESDNNSE